MIADLAPIEETQLGKDLMEMGEKNIVLAIKEKGRTDEEISEFTGLDLDVIHDLLKEED